MYRGKYHALESTPIYFLYDSYPLDFSQRSGLGRPFLKGD
jgi:hypothetical protein